MPYVRVNRRSPAEEPCPCDGCENFKECGTERLACRAFELFVEGKDWSEETQRVPSARLYQIITESEG